MPEGSPSSALMRRFLFGSASKFHNANLDTAHGMGDANDGDGNDIGADGSMQAEVQLWLKQQQELEHSLTEVDFDK
jgi:hypothetical protein